MENIDLAGEYRDLLGDYRELRKVPRPESACESDQGTELQQGQEDAEEDTRIEGTEVEVLKMPLPAAEEDLMSQSELFRFLTSAGQQGDDESESGGSELDAASISGLSQVTAGHGESRAVVRPGPWLKPSQQRVAQVVEESRLQTLQPGNY